RRVRCGGCGAAGAVRRVRCGGCGAAGAVRQERCGRSGFPNTETAVPCNSARDGGRFDSVISR
ncbi:MAG: hypothetical protein ACI4NG_05855, partial [Candidatus Gallimonas sp.]